LFRNTIQLSDWILNEIIHEIIDHLIHL